MSNSTKGVNSPVFKFNPDGLKAQRLGESEACAYIVLKHAGIFSSDGLGGVNV
jgi:hypothetical protein